MKKLPESRMTRILTATLLAWVAWNASASASLRAVSPRVSVSLDGTWQVEQGSMSEMPAAFTHTVAVPGLVDLAQPAFEGVGKPSPARTAFWYRRSFTIEGPVPEAAVLKIHKACYGTQVWLNGQFLGEHLPCFTPGYFNLKSHLRGERQQNELVVRVGAHRDGLPKGMPTGWDFEKYLYIPGIYDSVELILTGAPQITNIQTVPDIARGRVRVITEIDTGGKALNEQTLRYTVREAKSGREVCSESRTEKAAAADAGRISVETELPISNARLWSPEDPFLYEVTVSTGSDAACVRFGLREFRFEPGGKYATLNGKRYYLRGSNITAYRFFEDADRGDKPWRAEWVRKLHQQVKYMHWNSLRYCIGFPPEFWYDIADEEGILIQDEFPVWTLSEDPEKLQTEKLVPEYREWMRERWNHPCVVIWDAQNESSIKVSGAALQSVRNLDRSGRPWENGWAEPQADTDCVEAHPYLMIGFFNPAWGNQKFTGMKDMVKISGVPSLNAAQSVRKVPIIINEYAWLWLTRDGQPTCLTGPVYEKLLGANSTVEQRRQIYAKTLAAKTEFWRAKRECAGVLHFCTLGYSRPGDQPRPEGGATSDHWLDLEALKFEPNFERYVRDAFNPVGVMLDFWDDRVAAGSPRTLQVRITNDLEQDWQGPVRLKLHHAGQLISEQTQLGTAPGFGQGTVSFELQLSNRSGDGTIVAELEDHGATVRSVRDFKAAAAQ